MNRRKDCRSTQPIAGYSPARMPRRIQRQLKSVAAATWALEASPLLPASPHDDNQYARHQILRSRMTGHNPNSHPGPPDQTQGN